MKKGYRYTATLQKDTLIKMSLRDKINILLTKPSLLNIEDVNELMRIKRLKGFDTASKIYVEYINNLYNEHYNNQNQ